MFVFFNLMTLYAITAMADPVINLSTGGSVAPGTSFNLSLNGLVPSSSYSVVCYITSSYPFQYLLLGSQFTDTTSTIISSSINGNLVTQGELNFGQNIVVVNGKFTSPSTANLIYTNLDTTNPFAMNNCFAIPIQA
jgi:hypothetical protein